MLYILKSAGILTLFFVVYSILLKKETFFSTNRHFLLAGILSAFIFPMVQFTKTVIKEIPAMEQGIFEDSMSVPTSHGLTVLVSKPTYSWVTFENFWIAIYVLGLCYFLGRFALQLVTLLKWFTQYPSVRKNGFKIIEINEPIAPFSFFNYIVYNPNLHTHSELEMILQHEKVHARQSHSVDVLISHLLTAVQWFNPLAWMYKKCLEENLEFMADHHTASNVPSKKAYQLALVKASSAYPMPALTNYFYQSFIKKRIIMLNKNHSKKQNAFKAIFILPLLALFLWSFNVKEVTEWVTLPSGEKALEPSTADLIPSEKTIATKSSISNEPYSEIATQTTVEPENTSVPGLTNNEEYRVKITKNTTDTEFQKMKKELKDKFGIDLSYTTVRNDAKEIVSLSMEYQGNGRNGNYQVTDDEGIEDFYFFINEDGKSGFGSEATEERRVKRVKEIEERREEMEIVREKRKEEMEERREEMEERREEMEIKRVEMDKRRKEMEEKKVKEVILIDEGIDEVVEIEELDESQEYVITRDGRGDAKVAVVSNGKRGLTIFKNTTDAQLAKMKEDMASKNISFSYKNVKRNAQGEITSIKFSLDDHKGSKSTTVIKGDDNEPIDPIVIKH